MIKYAQAMGLDMIEGDYEDEGQIGFNWMYDHADLTADRLVTYRQICKQVARSSASRPASCPSPTPARWATAATTTSASGATA